MSWELGEGRVQRRCPDCGVTVDVAVPTGERDSRKRLKNVAFAYRVQLPWELLCDSCTDWWTQRLDALSDARPRALLARVEKGDE